MIRWLFKWMFRLALLLVLVAVLLLVFKNTIIRIVTEHRIRAETGMQAKIGRMSVGLFSPDITVDHLRIYNTPAFGGGIFLDVPELHLEYDRADLVRGKFHVTLLRLNLAEIDVVKNEPGQTNVTSIGGVKKKLKRLFPRSRRGLGAEVDFGGIDVLNLSLGKVRFIDLKDSSHNHDLSIGLKNEIVHDIKSEDDFYSALVLIWFRHGTELGISAADILSAFESKAKKAKSTNAPKAVPVP